MAGETPLPTSQPIRCSQCHATLDKVVICDSCHTVQPVATLNYFDLLGLPQQFDVDPAEIQKRYLNLARSVHPDRLGGISAEVTNLSLRTSAQVNEARKVLSNPVLRASYLLTLSGGKSAADDKTVPQAVLAETLMLREEIEEAQADNDDATLQSLEQQVQAKRDATLETIATLARQLPGDDALRTKLRAQLNAISYYEKMAALF